MSSLIPLALGLASISLSTSYILSSNSNTQSRLAEHPTPEDIDPLSSNPNQGPGYISVPPAYNDDGNRGSTSNLPDFNWDSFRYLIPLPADTGFGWKSSNRMPSDSEMAQEALTEESLLRFPTFKMEDAVTLGMNLRKRFRASSRHAKGKGCVISIQSMQGACMFACAVGEGSDVSLDAWWVMEGMIKVVRRTGHSSFYIEKGSNAIGKPPEQLGLPFPEYRINGGAFPIWLQSSTVGPIGVIGVYSGSSVEDHQMIIATLRSFFNRMTERAGSPSTAGGRDP
ncbi:hypothetical protein FRB96_001682 [Tulasnella sp. 330]|nr:hypothetical protein FRB96_001682 [Tulasnella sp. 330]KAG8882108.1 hypothetical protein FRB97_008674 [Tulasnella sp. 331]KAG8888013.1 hypothetical protein FRB98_008611 [Tulasnella sp. 332]